MKAFGFKKSEIDGSEKIFSVQFMKNEGLPKTYTYKKYLPNVLDQGEEPICVPCSLSTYLNWKVNLENGSKKDNKINYHEIYNSKTTNGDGMTFKEAFKYLRHEGVNSQAGDLTIDGYAMVKTSELLKYAIIMNGPCVGALPVYNFDYEFWNERRGDGFYGYHAIAIIGYDEEGFIIRNSWGTSFGDKGYTKIKYDEFNKLIECWTVIE